MAYVLYKCLCEWHTGFLPPDIKWFLRQREKSTHQKQGRNMIEGGHKHLGESQEETRTRYWGRDANRWIKKSHETLRSEVVMVLYTLVFFPSHCSLFLEEQCLQRNIGPEFAVVKIIMTAVSSWPNQVKLQFWWHWLSLEDPSSPPIHTLNFRKGN